MINITLTPTQYAQILYQISFGWFPYQAYLALANYLKDVEPNPYGLDTKAINSDWMLYKDFQELSPKLDLEKPYLILSEAPVQNHLFAKNCADYLFTFPWRHPCPINIHPKTKSLKPPISTPKALVLPIPNV